MGLHHHDHGHSCCHSSPEQRIGTAFFLNFGFAILELVGGYLTNSTAILADAIHDFGDSFSLLAAWYCSAFSRRKPTQEYSYGYRRVSLLGALLNGVVLLSGSVFVLSKAVPRLLAPEQPDARGMIFFAVIGIVVNGFAAWRMSGGKTMNEKLVTWHLWEDVLGWCVVLVGSIVMAIWHLPLIDPILCILITLYILWNVWKNFRETLHLFLQGVPGVLEIEKLLTKVKAGEPRILSVHDVHAWSLDGEHHIASIHLVLTRSTEAKDVTGIKTEVKRQFDAFGIEHVTVEIEWDGDDCDRKHGCCDTLHVGKV
jgi:cobalt-zinc-cadmium efflux system protein